MPVIDPPIPRADPRPRVRRRAPHTPRAVSSAPAHPERAEVLLAIDRWNNEGGFVYDADAAAWPSRRSRALDS
jgi:hypothetical protein